MHPEGGLACLKCLDRLFAALAQRQRQQKQMVKQQRREERAMLQAARMGARADSALRLDLGHMHL